MRPGSIVVRHALFSTVAALTVISCAEPGTTPTEEVDATGETGVDVADSNVEVSVLENEGSTRSATGCPEHVVLGGDAGDQLRGRGKGKCVDDQIVGGAGDDTLRGLRGHDEIFGGGGDDRLIGGRGNDLLRGGPGDDHLRGGRGDDELFPGSGVDFVHGGPGNDTIYLPATCDAIDGGTIKGGPGYDRLVLAREVDADLLAVLTVEGIEEIVTDDSLARPAFSSCAAPEPDAWLPEVEDEVVLWRRTTAEERRRNDWPLDSWLIENTLPDDAPELEVVQARVPEQGTLRSYDLVQTDEVFDAPLVEMAHGPGGEQARRLDVAVRRFERDVGATDTVDAWLMVTDGGHAAGIVRNATQNLVVAPSHPVDFVQPTPNGAPTSLTTVFPGGVDFPPATAFPEPDIQMGIAYGMEAQTCSRYYDGLGLLDETPGWIAEIWSMAYGQRGMLAAQLGVSMNPAYLYCNRFIDWNTTGQTPGDIHDYPTAYEMAAVCDSSTETFEDALDLMSPTCNRYDDDCFIYAPDYDCTDDEGHLYPYLGCGRNSKCYRDRAWKDWAHVGLHFNTPHIAAIQIFGPGLVHPNGAPEPFGSTTIGVNGLACIPTSTGPQGGFGGGFGDEEECGGIGGSSVVSAAKVFSPGRPFGAHELGHTLGASHDDTSTVPVSCGDASTLMATETDTCRVPAFSAASKAEIGACLQNSWCPLYP